MNLQFLLLIWFWLSTSWALQVCICYTFLVLGFTLASSTLLSLWQPSLRRVEVRHGHALGESCCLHSWPWLETEQLAAVTLQLQVSSLKPWAATKPEDLPGRGWRNQRGKDEIPQGIWEGRLFSEPLSVSQRVSCSGLMSLLMHWEKNRIWCLLWLRLSSLVLSLSSFCRFFLNWAAVHVDVICSDQNPFEFVAPGLLWTWDFLKNPNSWSSICSHLWLPWGKIFNFSLLSPP